MLKKMKKRCISQVKEDYSTKLSLLKSSKKYKKIYIQKLDALPKQFDDTLHGYQHLTKYSDTRINRLCKLKKLIQESGE